MSGKMRLDQLLLQRGLVESREQAQRLIRAGTVRVAGTVATKPGHLHDVNVECAVAEGPRYVSRGGEKLEAALQAFPIVVRDRVAVDIGASTGGFTDCLLQHGASSVYAVDVGKGQLHWKLRQDPRVAVIESCNARYLTEAEFDPQPTVGVVDVSFISLAKILPALNRVLGSGAEIITLIKPQFEAGRDQVGKGGVVRDAAVHRAVVEAVRCVGEKEIGWHWRGICESPVRGPAGNVEFLAYWSIP